MTLRLQNSTVRPPAVAGYFYPGDPLELRDMVDQMLDAASLQSLPAAAHAYIVPHAGFVYSGSVAAAAYASIALRRESIRRVVLVGPSHRVFLQGVALPGSDAFATPLGVIPIDREARRLLVDRGDVDTSDAPHALEHSLEVQLPFLQAILNEFELVPLVGGVAAPAQVGSILKQLWGGEETLVLASSDLSHYHSYTVAQSLDAKTSAAILQRSNDLSGEQACGAVAINGLMHAARDLKCNVTELARLNSGDTAGDKARVVGYGAFAIQHAHSFAT